MPQPPEHGPGAPEGRAPRANTFQTITTHTERTRYEFYEPFQRVWNMENCERLAMISLLSWLKPAVSIEIGTRECGSTAVIAANSQRVHTFDIDPSCRVANDLFPNVEFHLGSSWEQVPGVLQGIQERGESLEFALIDGDHSESSVRRDIECFLAYRPLKPCYVLMHDSFYPHCRQGMIDAPWSSSPYVHKVDLDFIPGRFHHPREEYGKMMWGGFGLATLRPEPRQGDVVLLASGDHGYRTILPRSSHRLLVLAKKHLPPSTYNGMKKLKRLLTSG